MVSKSTWKLEYKKEIEQARLARSNGNEGMARVCARRAAGVIIGEFLDRKGYPDHGNSAYDRLRMFTGLPGLDQRHKDIAEHLLVKVSQDRRFPVEADLISEVIWLANNLIGSDQG